MNHNHFYNLARAFIQSEDTAEANPSDLAPTAFSPIAQARAPFQRQDGTDPRMSTWTRHAVALTIGTSTLLILMFQAFAAYKPGDTAKMRQLESAVSDKTAQIDRLTVELQGKAELIEAQSSKIKTLTQDLDDAQTRIKAVKQATNEQFSDY